MLNGTRELAEQIFDLPVRIGTPLSVEGLIEVVNHPMHATGVGLLLYEDASGERKQERGHPGAWWKYSFNQLRRVIGSFI